MERKREIVPPVQHRGDGGEKQFEGERVDKVGSYGHLEKDTKFRVKERGGEIQGMGTAKQEREYRGGDVQRNGEFRGGDGTSKRSKEYYGGGEGQLNEKKKID